MKRILLLSTLVLAALAFTGCGRTVETTTATTTSSSTEVVITTTVTTTAATTATTTTEATTTEATTTVTDPPTIFDAVNALTNPYNIALFMNEDPYHYLNLNFVLPTVDVGAVYWRAVDNELLTYIMNADLKTTTVGNKTVYAYAATIGPLTPGTTYRYRVGNVLGTTLSEWQEYTAPQPDADFSFLYLADPQENAVTGYTAYAHAILSVMAYAQPEFDFAMFPGDMVNDADVRSQWNWFFQYSSVFCYGKPIVATIGNHEFDGISDPFMDRLEYDGYTNLPANGPVYGPFDELEGDLRTPGIDAGKTYSFDYGAAHIVAIDTEIFCDGLTACSDYDADNVAILLDWLANDLEAAGSVWKIVLLHRGPYALSYDSALIRTLLVPTLEAYGVDLVLAGHDHQYSRSVYWTGALAGFTRSDVYTLGTVSLLQETGGTEWNFNDYPRELGITYLVGNTAGTKYYGGSKSSGIPVHYEYDGECPVIPIITVTNDAITVVSYIVLKDSALAIVPTGVAILETFTIRK